MKTSPLQPLDTQERAACLLRQAGFACGFTLTPIHGGANSKTFLVELADSNERLVLKEYFCHPHDPRDRLGTEYAFASFAWRQGLRNLARPYARDDTQGCALYAFLDGAKLTPTEVAHSAVAQCLKFFCDLNRHKNSPEAETLPIASEACFSLNDHWECLRRRLRRLEAIRPEDALDRRALSFVCEKLTPVAAAHLAAAPEHARELGLDCTAPISAQDRCLSPSDFGFHNALAAPGGNLFFLDFEYAGWDDPAKMVCDFFCQPACPVSLDFWPDFTAAVAMMTADPTPALHRFALLLPTYRLKWCCIMLNDFLPAGAGRRQFANHDLDASIRKERQLEKAQEALQQFRTASATNRAA